MNERSLFLAALEITDPVARAVYLDKACGNDPILRQRVDALFKSHDEAGSFLEKPAAADAATGAYTPVAGLNEAGPGSSSPLSPLGKGVGGEGPGSRIGPYKLLQQIGEGGMGVVYMAEQERAGPPPGRPQDHQGRHGLASKSWPASKPNGRRWP